MVATPVAIRGALCKIRDPLREIVGYLYPSDVCMMCEQWTEKSQFGETKRMNEPTFLFIEALLDMVTCEAARAAKTTSKRIPPALTVIAI
jgi:hypothetical protein